MSRLYIDKDSLMMKINANLIYWGGGGFGRIFFDMLVKTNYEYKDDKPRFFQPFKKKADLINIYTPITAPVTFLLLAAEMTLGFVVYTLNSLYYAFKGDGKEFKESVKIVGQSLLNTLLFCVAAIISPLVCLFKVLGSGINTALDACSDDNSNRSCCV